MGPIYQIHRVGCSPDNQWFTPSCLIILLKLAHGKLITENSSVSTCPHHVRSETQGLQLFNVYFTCQQQCLLGFNLSGTGQRWKPLKTGIGPPLPTPGTLNYWKLNCCWVAGLLYWGIFSSFSMVQKNNIQKYVGCFPYVICLIKKSKIVGQTENPNFVCLEDVSSEKNKLPILDTSRFYICT